jgi:hypothetical protein
MSPFIKDDDVVTVSPSIPKQPRLGEVVAFIHPVTGELLVHRVVGRRGDSHFLVKGDSIREVDGLVPQANILGYVRKVERRGKEFSLGLGPERILIAFLGRRGLVPLLLFVSRLFRPFMRRTAF